MATQEQKAKFQEIYTAAKNAGIPHPEVIAAQWAVESGWGAKQSGKNNYWGIKAGDGNPNNNSAGTVVMTHEVIGGKKIQMPQKFRDYETLEEALKDRANFTSKSGGRYDKAGYFTATSPAEAAQALQKAGYATDPNYANTLISVMKSGGINPYDGQKYDYSTTKPNTNTALTPPYQPQMGIAEQLTSTFTPPKTDNAFTNYFEQINGTLDPLNQLESTQPKISNRQKYKQQLADAFGIEPKVGNGLPDYISGLVQSIYDQTA